jgi:pyridoxamine 5'-phosphate oxidase
VEIADDPIARFVAAQQRAGRTEALEATAAALATADATGRPAVRMVLVKVVSADGFQVHTNYESRKGRELDRNPRAALSFHWPTVGEQVRVEGAVRRCTAEESDAYFATRPRLSQVGAWASKQSSELASRSELEASVREVEARFSEVAVPRPPFWGGYVIMPETIEFWSQGDFRLHDREVYVRDPKAGGWVRRRLWP